MADWLNVVLAGPYSITVYRDGVSVDPASVGATLSVTAGVITLETPAQTHEWEIEVTPELPASKFRFKDWSFTPTLDSASAGTEKGTQSLTLGPPTSPDPLEMTEYATQAVVLLVESA